MGWFIIITIILAAVISYFVYIAVAFKRVNYTRCYPEINMAHEEKELKQIFS